MHVMIKGNYLNLDDILYVTNIRQVGGDGWMGFVVHYKNDDLIEFNFHSSITTDICASKRSFNFGTYAFFLSAYNDIIKTLTSNAFESNGTNKEI